MTEIIYITQCCDEVPYKHYLMRTKLGFYVRGVCCNHTNYINFLKEYNQKTIKEINIKKVINYNNKIIIKKNLYIISEYILRNNIDEDVVMP